MLRVSSPCILSIFVRDKTSEVDFGIWLELWGGCILYFDALGFRGLGCRVQGLGLPNNYSLNKGTP